MGVKLVRELCEDAEIDVNDVDKGGRTALISASKHRHVEIVKLLIEKGAEVDLSTKAVETVVMAANHNGHEEVLKLFANVMNLRIRKLGASGGLAKSLARQYALFKLRYGRDPDLSELHVMRDTIRKYGDKELNRLRHAGPTSIARCWQACELEEQHQCIDQVNEPSNFK